MTGRVCELGRKLWISIKIIAEVLLSWILVTIKKSHFDSSKIEKTVRKTKKWKKNNH